MPESARDSRYQTVFDPVNVGKPHELVQHSAEYARAAPAAGDNVDFAQLLVDQRNESVKRVLIPTFPLQEQFAYGFRRQLGHLPTTGGKLPKR